jgi:NAD(P)-dependent dehydrogenase (short-subunit alcohol dehydrogenase family)
MTSESFTRHSTLDTFMNFPFNQFQLTTRTALITGGAGGLGQVFARALAGAGANIALLGRRAEAAQAAAEGVAQEFGVKAISVAADVTNAEQVRKAVAQVKDQLGTIDILINSAGINVRKPSLEFSVEDFRRVVDVSVTGSFICAQAVAPGMIENKWGRIINLSSMLGQVGLGERPAYTAAKGALIQLTKTLALEWAKHGVNVNALAPGPFLTELNLPVLNNPPANQFFLDRLPIARWASPKNWVAPSCSSPPMPPRL